MNLFKTKVGDLETANHLRLLCNNDLVSPILKRVNWKAKLYAKVFKRKSMFVWGLSEKDIQVLTSRGFKVLIRTKKVVIKGETQVIVKDNFYKIVWA